MNTALSKLMPLALASGIFLTACGNTGNENTVTEAETATSSAEISVKEETEAAAEETTAQETEVSIIDLTGLPAEEVFEYTVYDDHVVIDKCIQFGDKITVPEEIEGVKVTEIGGGAFYNITDISYLQDYISEIVLPDSIEVIGVGAFSNCGSITGLTINFPKNLRVIEENAFVSSGIQGDIEIPGTVSEIKANAFHNCIYLESVTLGSGITALQNSSFSGCEKLSNVVIPDSVTSIDYYCFSGCSSLRSIDFPESVTKFVGNAFNHTPLAEENQPLIINNILVDYTSAEGEIVLPENITEISEYAFARSDVTSIVIPDSVTEIGPNAFYRCKSLESITLPKNLTEINEQMFTDCESLKSIVIPDTVTRIGNDAFNGSALESIQIPESVTYFGSSAFSKTPFAAAQQPLIINDILCDWSTASGDITLPDNFTIIGAGAFMGNESITSVTIPDTVTRIEERAFSRCEDLSDISIPSSVEYIGSTAFGFTAYEQNNEPLIMNDILYSWKKASGDISVPDGVREIDAFAFFGCETVTGITVPDSVTSIGDRAFGKCTKLVSVSLPSGVELGPDVFMETPADEDSSMIEYR